jgi:hypothetical protein
MVRACLALDPLARPQSVFAVQKVLQAAPRRRRAAPPAAAGQAQAAGRLARPARTPRRLRPQKSRKKLIRLGITCSFPSTSKATSAGARSTRTAWATASRATLAAGAGRRHGRPPARRDRRHHRPCRPCRPCSSSRPRPTSRSPSASSKKPSAGAPRDPALHAREHGCRKPAHHHRRLPGPAQLRRVGALRRLAPVLGAARPDPGAHARPLAHRAPDRQGPGRSVRARTHPDRNKLYNCLGASRRRGRAVAPGQPGAGRRAAAVLRRPVGACCRTPRSCTSCPPTPSCRRCPT